MSRSLRPETQRKKELEAETLPDFLARMTLVWEKRQLATQARLAKAAEVARRSAAKRKAEDPEGWRAARLEAVRRYEERHPDRIAAKRERDRQRRARLAAALAVSKQVVKAEKAAQRAADAERARAERAARSASGGSLGGRAGSTRQRPATALPVAPRAWFSL